MKAGLKGLKHSKEQLYGTLVIVFGLMIWPIVIAGVVAVIFEAKTLAQFYVLIGEIVAIVVFLYIARLFFRAHLFGHAVLIGADQFPTLHASLVAGSAKLGLDTVPQAFLYNSNGLMNAFATKIAGTRMVLLTSALIDVQNDRQVDFVIGHELGHHAAGHLNVWMNLIKFPGTFVPFLGAAYHRSRELTADRIGAYCNGDCDASRSALHMLACGSARMNSAMNADAFAAQEEMVPPITGFLLHIFSGYPRLTRRVNEVEAYFRNQHDANGSVSARPVNAYA